MEFIADKQTLNDLNILGKYKNNSLFFIFNQVKTRGGEKLLEQYFQHPLTDHEAINRRSQALFYFQERSLEFPFSAETFEVMESYLISGGGNNWFNSGIQFLRRGALKVMGLAAEYNQLLEGFSTTIHLLQKLRSFLGQIQQSDPQNPFREDIQGFEEKFLNLQLLQLKDTGKQKKSAWRLFRSDHFLRQTCYPKMQELLSFLYKMDVFLTVAEVGRKQGWIYATALPAVENILAIQGVRHPAISKAVGNAISMNRNSNVIFLTGANMAGKSTLMKSAGIAVYLAHMGFPVAANDMRFSVKNGIISSINVPDDLNKGFSHFYAEVLRVKEVAKLVKDGHDVVVIFDELFKGTNVKDAYDATLSVTEAFTKFENCNYIISTHIIEVGEALKECCPGMQFRFMPTVMEGNTPRYPYVMRDGITADRHGLTIIENERILENL